jgi:hypothetical protein
MLQLIGDRHVVVRQQPIEGAEEARAVARQWEAEQQAIAKLEAALEALAEEHNQQAATGRLAHPGRCGDAFVQFRTALRPSTVVPLERRWRHCNGFGSAGMRAVVVFPSRWPPPRFIPATDPIVIGEVTDLLAIVAVAPCALPARRASIRSSRSPSRSRWKLRHGDGGFC